MIGRLSRTKQISAEGFIFRRVLFVACATEVYVPRLVNKIVLILIENYICTFFIRYNFHDCFKNNENRAKKNCKEFLICKVQSCSTLSKSFNASHVNKLDLL